jgi:hypothetical protein
MTTFGTIAETALLPRSGTMVRRFFILLFAFVALHALRTWATPNIFPLAEHQDLDLPANWFALELRALTILVAFLLSACALWRAPAVPRFEPGRHAVLLSIAAATLLAAAGATVALRCFPNSGDEYHMLFQAETFREGRLWQDPLPLQQYFSFAHIMELGGKRVSHFPPGWPLLVAGWTALGLPACLAGPAAGALLLVGVAALARETAGGRAVLPSVILVAATPFFLFNAASYFSHTIAAAWMLFFWLFGTRFIQRPAAGNAALAGLCLGWLAITRYYTALLTFLPFAVALLPRLRARHVRYGLVAALAGACILVPFLAYNQAVTGSPLQTVSSWAYPKLKLGLWAVAETGVHSGPIAAFKRAGLQILELLEWTSPAFVTAYAGALFVLVRRRALRAMDTLPVLFVLAFLLYPDVGWNRYGPRYYFDPFPFAALAVVRAGLLLWDEAKPRIRPLLGGLATAHFAFAISVLPFAAVYMRLATDERLVPYEEAERLKLKRALVVLTEDTGELRPLAIWGMTRNGTHMNPAAPVLWAADRGAGTIRLLSQYFSERSIWLWDGVRLTCVQRCALEQQP